MRIANNIPALTAFASLNKTNNKLSKTLTALSTGLRINSASDDAAGFAISEKMRSQISGLDIALRNSQDGISLLQTAEGALGETNAMLQRMRELAIQASNDSLTSNDRQYIQLEIDELKKQIDRIADTTQFNKRRILDGSAGAMCTSSDINVKAKINGGLTYIDRFRQKVSSEGNYRIEINADGGKAQIQKTNIMLIKHKNVTMDRTINNFAGVNDINVNDLPPGYYNLDGEPPTEAHAFATGAYGIELDELDSSLKASVRNSLLLNNASILFEVTDVDDETGKITVRASANILKTDGTSDFVTQEKITLKEGDFNDLSSLLKVGIDGTDDDKADGGFELQLQNSSAKNFEIGDKFVYNLSVAEGVEGTDRVVKIANNNNVGETKEIYKTNSFKPKEDVYAPARVVFLVDRSGSMGSVIDTVASNLTNFVNNIAASGTPHVTIDANYAVAAYSTMTNPDTGLYGPYMEQWDIDSDADPEWSNNVADIGNALNGPLDVDPTTGACIVGTGGIGGIDPTGTYYYSRPNLTGALQDHYAAIVDAINDYGLASISEQKFIVLVTDTDQEYYGSAYSKADVVAALKSAGVQCSIIRPSYASRDLDDIASEPDMIFNQSSSSWGTDLSTNLAKKIGDDTLAAALASATPLYQFEQFSSIFPSASSPSQELTITQDGVSTTITVDPTDTLKTLSDKIDAVTGAETRAEAHDDEDDTEKGITLTTNLPEGTSVKFSGDREFMNILGFRSNLEQKFSLDTSEVKNKNIHFRQYYIDPKSGHVYNSDIIMTTDDDIELEEWGFYSRFEAAYVGQIPKQDVKLRDINQFWNSQGVFMLDPPQTLTITQGDGQTASITLYESDTIEDVRQKLNDAIGYDLGQLRHTNSNNFASFVKEGEALNYGEEAVEGTMIIRSAIPGKAGELYFSGDEDLLKALGLNTIQESEEAIFTASVYDAHTGVPSAVNLKASGSVFQGIIPNVDLEFDSMAGLFADWNETTKSFVTTHKDSYEVILHLKDNSTVFQVGANKGEDFMVQLGDSSCNALGISGITVATRETASRSISILDKAITKLSSQRAKIGAYQNALEHTMENLTTTSTNLTAAESRIRDADMSKMMMDFVKLQILNQSGTSMLAQANQLPQSVMGLLQ